MAAEELARGAATPLLVRAETQSAGRGRRDGRECDDGAPDVADELHPADLALAHEIGWPLLIKAVGGGGGRGMKQVHEPDRLAETMDLAISEAQAASPQARAPQPPSGTVTSATLHPYQAMRMMALDASAAGKMIWKVPAVEVFAPPKSNTTTDGLPVTELL